VVEAARAAGLDIEPVEYADGTRTVAEAAASVGVGEGQIVKSLVFTIDGDLVMALMSGSNRLSGAALATAAGHPGATTARPDAEAVREGTGFAIGGVPPFGHRQPLPTYIDADLLTYDIVFAAAGTHQHAFGIEPLELVRVSGGAVADIAER
jgi:prolyl-tRNA editing enzyme YbaK/EbsC (Cys-tRNA(Pro) deacylase)